MVYLKVFLESPSVEFLPAYKGVLENHRSLQAVDMPICILDSAIALVWLRLQPHNCPMCTLATPHIRCFPSARSTDHKIITFHLIDENISLLVTILAPDGQIILFFEVSIHTTKIN